MGREAPGPLSLPCPPLSQSRRPGGLLKLGKRDADKKVERANYPERVKPIYSQVARVAELPK